MTDSEMALCTAFLQGAKFWEYYISGGTMWQADQNFVWEKAQERLAQGELGKDRIKRLYEQGKEEHI